MNGFIIEDRGCPRCGMRRTGRVQRSFTAFCFNCHFQWDTFAAADAAEPFPPHAFSDEELARLRTYRAAVRNGFYTDC